MGILWLEPRWGYSIKPGPSGLDLHCCRDQVSGDSLGGRTEEDGPDADRMSDQQEKTVDLEALAHRQECLDENILRLQEFAFRQEELAQRGVSSKPMTALVFTS